MLNCVNALYFGTAKKFSMFTCVIFAPISAMHIHVFVCVYVCVGVEVGVRVSEKSSNCLNCIFYLIARQGIAH